MPLIFPKIVNCSLMQKHSKFLSLGVKDLQHLTQVTLKASFFCQCPPVHDLSKFRLQFLILLQPCSPCLECSSYFPESNAQLKCFSSLLSQKQRSSLNFVCCLYSLKSTVSLSYQSTRCHKFLFVCIFSVYIKDLYACLRK